jgi:hypothetical protein
VSKYTPRSQLTPQQLDRVRRKAEYYQRGNRKGQTFRCKGDDLKIVEAHVRMLCRQGMSVGDIHEVSGIAEMTVRAIRDGNRTWIAHRVARALLMVKPEVTGGNQRTPFLPTQRRAQALFCDGYTFTYMGAPVGWQANAMWRLAHGYGMAGGSFHTQVYVYRRTAETVKRLYDKMAGARPEDHGVPTRMVRYAQRRGRALGWAPSHCWDWDTIEDPDAHPEWTGECGTERGYRLHVSHGIKVCPPCHDAHYGGWT